MPCFPDIGCDQFVPPSLSIYSRAVFPLAFDLIMTVFTSGSLPRGWRGLCWKSKRLRNIFPLFLLHVTPAALFLSWLPWKSRDEALTLLLLPVCCSNSTGCLMRCVLRSNLGHSPRQWHQGQGRGNAMKQEMNTPRPPQRRSWGRLSNTGKTYADPEICAYA